MSKWFKKWIKRAVEVEQTNKHAVLSLSDLVELALYPTPKDVGILVRHDPTFTIVQNTSDRVLYVDIGGLMGSAETSRMTVALEAGSMFHIPMQVDITMPSHDPCATHNRLARSASWKDRNPS